MTSKRTGRALADVMGEIDDEGVCDPAARARVLAHQRL